MFGKYSLEEFLKELGSNQPAPGGGTASALAGALAGSLVQMVAHLSDEEAKEYIPQAESLGEKLLQLAADDTVAFNQVMAAYRLPKQTEPEKKKRSEAIQRAIKKAAEVPFEIMETAFQALELAKEMAFHGNPNTLSDAGVASLLAIAACRGAAYNVLINLPSLKDKEFSTALKIRLTKLLEQVEEIEQLVADHILQILSQ